MAICNYCGQEIPDGAQVCPNCGQALGVTPNIQATEMRPVQTMAPQGVWYNCKKCGAMIPGQVGSPIYNCPMCGQALQSKEKSNTAWTVGRIISIASILLTFVASFLPFFTCKVLGVNFNISLWSDKFIMDAIIYSVLLAIGFLFVCGHKKTKGRVAAICSIFILAGIYLDYSMNQERLANYHTSSGYRDLSGLLNPGVGLYLMVLGCIGIIVASFVMHIGPKE